jgi:hypothetical protein
MLEFCRALDPRCFLRRAGRELAVTQFCMTRRVDLLRALLAETAPRELRSLARPPFKGGMRLLVECGRAAEAAEHLSVYLADADPELKLYFLDVIRALPADFDVALPAMRNWREVLAYFRSVHTAPDEAARREFLELFVAPLEELPADRDRDFMDVRMDPERRRELERIILDRLRAGQPLSLIRLGDGEAYAFDPPPMRSVSAATFAEEDETRERMVWGAIPAPHVRRRIKAECFEAIAHADILGVPGVHRLIRDRGRSGTRMGDNRQQRGVAAVLHAVRRQLPKSHRLYTEEYVNQVLFTPAFIEELAAAAKRVIVVGCWPRTRFAVEILSDAEFVLIPPSQCVDDAQTGDFRPLFESYGEIIEDIRGRSAPGTLVLVGAGLIGKIFLHAARTVGAVALDIGSTMDYLAGRMTRAGEYCSCEQPGRRGTPGKFATAEPQIKWETRS